jgi:hypothetical protein
MSLTGSAVGDIGSRPLSAVANRQKLFFRRQLVAEGGLGVAFGGDHLLDLQQMSQPDRLDNFVSPIPAGRRGIEQVGVGANGGQGQPCVSGEIANFAGMRVKAD